VQVLTKRRLQDFQGIWRIRRKIHVVGQPKGDYTGHALWTPRDDCLVYVEEGELQMPGHPPMRSQRKYVWGKGLKVYFEDGRFFHTVPPEGGTAHHFCDPDAYQATYRFDSWPRFEVTWSVSGPRKDYTMVSHYSPSRSEPA